MASGMGLQIGGMAEQDIANFIGAYYETQAQLEGITNAENRLTPAYQQAEATMQPYADFGQQGMSRLSSLGNFSFSPSDMENYPGYQFEKSQGQAGINASAFARGTGMSSATSAALSNLNQQMAGRYYDQAYKQALAGYEANVSGAMGQVNIGYNATNRISNLQQAYGEQYADLALMTGNAKSAGYKAAQNAADEQGAHLQQMGSSMNSSGGSGSGGGGSGSGGGGSGSDGGGSQDYTGGISQSPMLTNNSNYMSNMQYAQNQNPYNDQLSFGSLGSFGGGQ